MSQQPQSSPLPDSFHRDPADRILVATVALLRSPMAGALWETCVIGQVIRQFQATRDASPLWF